MVGFTAVCVCVAADASAVSDDEGDPLSGGSSPFGTPVPQDFAVGVEELPGEFADAPVVAGDSGRDDTGTDELGFPFGQ